MRRKKTGFTLVELLTVLAIITLLVGLLVPSMAVVRRLARETKQRAQLNTIDLALTAFRDGYGEYPPSARPLGPAYCGAQMLAEALLGRDLLGFHPDSEWRLDDEVYNTTQENLGQRIGPYLERATTDAFTLGDLFVDRIGESPLNPDTFVICDAFAVREVTLTNGDRVRAGTPILYYRANPASRNIDADDLANRIYNAGDNLALLRLRRIADGEDHPLGLQPVAFYEYITDPSVVGIPWPYRPDSYILISAGADGLYGTPDDITNFGN